jgi:hypothetical protein
MRPYQILYEWFRRSLLLPFFISLFFWFFGAYTKFQQEKIPLPVDHGKLFATLAGTGRTVSFGPALKQIEA